jgi:hypothetical protein
MLSAISAEEITVFYKGKPTIKDTELVKENGHSIVYLQMDLINDIEDEVSERSTQTHKAQLNDIVNKYGREKLMAMSHSDRSELFLKEFTNSGINLYKTEMSQQDIAQIKKATKIIEFANEQGVTPDMLPAILFKGNLYRNVTTYAFLFKEENK